MSLDVLLRDELARRRAHNPAYSLRAFARDLKVSLTALSAAISGTRRLSLDNATKALAAIPLKTEEASALLAEEKARFDPGASGGKGMSEEEFAPIADWYHFAILSIAKLPSAPAAPADLAQRLGISEDIAAAAVARLVERRWVEVVHGTLRRTSIPFVGAPDPTSPSLNACHRQHLELGLLSLERDHAFERELTSLTCPVNSSRLPEAKLRVQRFSRSLARFLRRGPCDTVYAICVGLYPATRAPRKR